MDDEIYEDLEEFFFRQKKFQEELIENSEFDHEKYRMLIQILFPFNKLNDKEKKEAKNVVDSFFGKNCPVFFQDNAALLELVRQIFENHINDPLTLEEIKDNLIKGTSLTLSAKYIFTEDGFVFEDSVWETPLKNAIKKLVDLGYNIQKKNDTYIYNDGFNRYANCLNYFNEPALRGTKFIEILESSINKKNVEVTFTPNNPFEVRDFITKIFDFFFDPQTHTWDVTNFNSIDLPRLAYLRMKNPKLRKIPIECMFENKDYFLDNLLYYFPYFKGDTNRISYMRDMLNDFNGEDITEEHLIKLNECCIDLINNVFQEQKKVILTPYLINDKLLFGGKAIKGCCLDSLHIIDIDKIVDVKIHPYSQSPKVHLYPYNKINDRLKKFYKRYDFKTIEELIEQVKKDKQGKKFVEYRIKYKEDDNQKIWEIQKDVEDKFFSVDHLNKDTKNWQGENFESDDKNKVFEFVNKYQNLLMKFTNKSIQNKYIEWLNNKRKQEIENKLKSEKKEGESDNL